MAPPAALDRGRSAAYHQGKMQQAHEVHETLQAGAALGLSLGVLPSGFCARLRQGLRPWWRGVMPVALALAFSGAAQMHGQEEHKRKLPVLDKITSSNGQEAFSGSGQSLDWKTSLLLVHSTRDNT